MKMQVTLIGTGTSQGVPVIGCNCEVCASLDSRDQRLRTAALIEIEGKVIVIDTGPDFRQQMLREQVNQLDAVLFTHEHKDHVAGLDDVRAFNFIQRKKMDVYATAQVQEALKREYEYIFSDYKYPGIPEIELNTINGKEDFEVKGIRITPIEVMHHKLPVLGFRINDFTYITDAKTITPENIEKIKGSKVLVLNALRIEEHLSHFNLEEALALAEQIGAEKTYLTHISHYLGRHEKIAQQLPESVELSYDGIQFSL